MVVGRRSHLASLKQAKRDLKKENIRSPNDAWKWHLKSGIGEIAKASWGSAPGLPQRGLTVPHMNTWLQGPMQT